METFEHDGVTIAYERRGQGSAVLFVHNGGTSSTIWRHQMAALEHSHEVVAIDLPGFGCSPRPQGGVDHQQQVHLVSALIDHLEIAPVVIVGNCMGSNLAAAVALAHPDAVRGLILVNPLTEATFSAGGIGLLHRVKRWLPWPSQVGRNIARRVVPPRIASSATVLFQVGERGRKLGLHHDPALLSCNQRRDQMPALVDVLDDMDTYGTLDREAEALREVPVCTVWGAQNRVLSPRAGQHLDEAIAPARSETLESCGHLVMLEEPARVTTIIESFIADLAPAVTS